jgi:CelD/BcsL family acetyltransferase involved in cellulose biosynthesis
MTDVKIVNTLDEARWREFVDGHPLANVFHTPEMFQVFSQAKGHQPSLWGAVTDREQVLALLLPVFVGLASPLLRGLPSRAILYGGALCAPGPEGAGALATLLRAHARVARRRSLFTELRNLSDVGEMGSTLCAEGFVREDHLNYLIDLTPPVGAIFQNIGRRARKHIRRGLSRGEVVVEEVTEREQIAVWDELLRRTYKLAKVPLADRSLFEAAFDVLYPRGMVRFTLARVGQVPAAVSVELLYQGIMYGWYGGVDRSYASYLPNELLTWHILKWGAENGYRLYDFGGAGKPDEEYGVRDFKAKFGGQLVNFGRHVRVYAPLTLALARVGFQAYRSIMQCLPKPRRRSNV